jgi:cytochrome c553
MPVMTRVTSKTAFHFGLAVMVGLLALACTDVGVSGNAAEGAKKSRFCATCHGPDGNDTHSGTPRLAGQSEAQFIQNMQLYKSGQRLTHPMMTILTKGMTKQDIADLGAFYAAQKVEESLKPYRQPQ